MTDIANWEPVDDNNNSAPPAGSPEGCLPSTVNNTMRAMMGATRRWYERTSWIHDPTGSANDIILTYEVTPSLAIGDALVLGPSAANTGAVTLNVGTGVFPVLLAGAALRGGELQANVPVWLFWVDGAWMLAGAAGGGDVLPPLIAATGSANALTLVYTTGAPIALTAGDRFTVFVSATNTGPATLTVQGMGPAAIFAQGSPLTGGELVTNAVVDFVWDGTNFHLLDPATTGVFMPLAGGTFTGPITVPGITCTGNIAANVIAGQAVNSNGNLGVSGNVNIGGSLQAVGSVTATSFVDSNGLLLMDVIQALEARVAALEARG